MPAFTQTPLDNGIAVIHSNQLEALRDVVEYWVRQHPLAPLESDVFLVQSNGMGQWLKQSLAQNHGLGIAAALQIQLPSLFIWSVYRAVLGQQIPKEQPLAKAPLTWRLYRLLPTLIQRPEFAALAHFLAQDISHRKHYQLAEQLADLFDQYQVYRSDWISDWARGDDSIRNAHGEAFPLPPQQTWQATLWRAVLDDLGDALNPFASRASVHAQFMAHIDALPQRPSGLPRRIILFGLSSLPQQSLEVLAKLGKFCQIVLFVHNPCQHYWADIIEDKDLLKAERRRQSYKAGMSGQLNPDELHLHANPLLAAWGKQGRDYIRLLDQFDETQAYANWHWPEQKIDLFRDYGVEGERSLLQRLQQSILDLEPTPAQPEALPFLDDSLAFHVAHSPQREVEILHDQLLTRFNAAASTGSPLTPREVIVMVPDINQYAPHIRAVFGQVKADDPRYIPFSLADQQQRGNNPLLVALEVLLNLSEARFSVSEFLGLLEVPALRLRFDLPESAMPKLQQWLEQSGVRWGLNAEHRARSVAMPANFEANTWQFGLRRMLLGYAVGDGDAFKGIEPYAEIGGLDAQWLGHLCDLLDTLQSYAKRLHEDRTPVDWQVCLDELLQDFFLAESDRDLKTLDNLRRALQTWMETCLQGGFGPSDTLPLHVVREAWLSAVDEPHLQQRFLSGRVNFCTLMPMRAIPFRLICLLGMNDGDYPRSHYPQGFDLMNQRGQYRPGDRSRRQDDQYLFLEALLSARQQLYISWVGRSIRDNSERPPSVLIGQLRDFIRQSWQHPGAVDLLAALTIEHPLQPFSREYVKINHDPRLFTYAKEWFEAPAQAPVEATPILASEETRYSLTLEALARFLKAPVKTYCQQTLKFSFDSEQGTTEDDEPFGFDHLQLHQYRQALLDDVRQEQPADLQAFFQREMSSLGNQGKLPLGGFADIAFSNIAQPVQQVWETYSSLLQCWPTALEALPVELRFEVSETVTLQLSAGLNQLRQAADQSSKALITSMARSLFNKKDIQYHNVLLPWLQHLVACAEGLAVSSFIVGSDGVLEIQPIASELALSYLTDCLKGWYQGQQRPLPIACRTALVYLSQPDNAAAQYEGNGWTKGEIQLDAYLARFFPDFESLLAAETLGFDYWAEKLYAPLRQQVDARKND